MFTSYDEIPERNILGTSLQKCCCDPITGFFRNGYCTSSQFDVGNHIVCAIMTIDFLDFSKSKGNDLLTPTRGFPGLKAGDRWCLCASRWQAAYNAGVAPPVIPEATHAKVLDIIDIKTISSKYISNERKI